ncbi:MAG: coagulation factor 5/8 type domain-containing protein [Bacteroidales bacterium]
MRHYLRFSFFIILLVDTLLLGAKQPDDPCSKLFSKYNNTVLGPNVFVFDPGMNMKEVQVVLDTLYKRQVAPASEFNNNRYSVFFKPGRYDLDVKVGYYMQVAGLGSVPGDVIISGDVRSLTTHHGNVLCNFWRSVENLTIIPRSGTCTWGVSQASPMRRVHIKGNLNLFDKGYASGGFLADSKVDGVVSSGPQQQWFTRNTEMSKWDGGVWNMMFMGVSVTPDGEWPDKPYTKIQSVPVVREKPFVVAGKNGYSVFIPELKKDAAGISWKNGFGAGKIIPLKEFYITSPAKDNAATMNAALSKGKHLFVTPGRYNLEASLKVNRAGTVILGYGMASLMPVNGTPAIEIADINGVIVAGLTVDAGPATSPCLFSIGDGRSALSHAADPVFLSDIFFRVGGPAQGSAVSCLKVNSNDVVIDHVWLWRADHGNGVGWNRNRCANGLVVNGDNVTIYGLFNEHFQEYQTLWNGNNGKVYFYQSEMPYDPPAVDAWKHGSAYGYASYKVSDNVESHEAWGMGIYNVFYDAPVIVDNAIETPASIEEKIHHKIIFWLNGNKESVVRSIINGKGGEVNVNNRRSVMK